MKNQFQKKQHYLILALVLTIILAFVQAAAQTTAFNFQGRLNDGSNPANGRYDLEFRLYDALTGGNQVNSTISKSNLTLINGVFSTQLDFGLMAFSGGNRFIEVGLRQSVTGNTTPNAFVILGPRQQILSVPYAIRSLRSTLADDATHAVNADNATNAANAVNSQNAINAQNATNSTNATNAQTAVNSQQLGGVAASQYVQQGSFRPVKAMIYFNPYLGNQKIARCYNSQLSGAASTTVPCGFTVQNVTDDNTSLGHWSFNFGFDLSDSFFSLTTVTSTSGSGRRMTVSSIAGGFVGSGNGGNIGTQGIMVITKYTDDQSFTNDPFFVVVY